MAIFFNSIKAEIFTEKEINHLKTYPIDTLEAICKQWEDTIDHISDMIDNESEHIKRLHKELAQVTAIAELVKSIIEEKRSN